MERSPNDQLRQIGKQSKWAGKQARQEGNQDKKMADKDEGVLQQKTPDHTWVEEILLQPHKNKSTWTS